MDRAIADDFEPSPHCDPGMGHHYLNFDRLDDKLVPSQPEVLLYAPDGKGGLRLVDAEWVVVDEDQNLETDQSKLVVSGHEMEGPMPGHFLGMPVHYDLYAFAWVPGGGFATTNPVVTC